MRNYGFDYLVEKTHLLTEMPKSNIYDKIVKKGGEEYYKKFGEIWKNVMAEIKAQSGQAAAQRLAYDYVIINLAKEIVGEKIQGSFVGTRTTDYAKDNLEQYLNWYKEHKGVSKTDPKYGPMAQSNMKKEFYLINLIKQNPEKATSDKMRKTLLNDKNIKTFLSKPGGYDASLNSGTADFAKRSKEEMFGTDLSDILQKQGAVMPLLKQINKFMAQLRKGKWESGDEEFEATQSPSMILADKMLEISTLIGAKALDFVDKNTSPLSAKAERENDPKRFFTKNLTRNQISQISSGIEQLIDNKVGVDKDTWRKKAANISAKVSPIFGDFMLFLLDAAEQEEVQQIDESDIYEGYDSRVLDKVLDSDEKWEIFDQWYAMEKIRRQKQNAKQNVDAVGDVSEFNKALDTKLGTAPKKKPVQKDEFDDEEDNEGVLSYMSEQITKDSLHNTIGEFKDRGFRRVSNYNQWLLINER